MFFFTWTPPILATSLKHQTNRSTGKPIRRIGIYKSSSSNIAALQSAKQRQTPIESARQTNRDKETRTVTNRKIDGSKEVRFRPAVAPRFYPTPASRTSTNDNSPKTPKNPKRRKGRSMGLNQVGGRKKACE